MIDGYVAAWQLHQRLLFIQHFPGRAYVNHPVALFKIHRIIQSNKTKVHNMLEIPTRHHIYPRCRGDGNMLRIPYVSGRNDLIGQIRLTGRCLASSSNATRSHTDFGTEFNTALTAAGA